jgi:hypothetical protein
VAVQVSGLLLAPVLHSAVIRSAAAQSPVALRSAATIALTAATEERTVTTLAANIGPGSQVTLTASVTTAARPAAAVADGRVRFYDNRARLALGIAASGRFAGSYTLTVARPLSGLQQVVAVYSPFPGSSYLGSRSAAVFFREPSGCRNCARSSSTSTQNSDDGVLSLSTPFTATSPLSLGTLTLNSSGTFYTASAWLDPAQSDVPTEGGSPDASFNGITVVDTQAANTPWTVSALASDLSDSIMGSGDLISSEDVGLTNLTAVAVPGDPLTGADLTFTDLPAASPPVAPGDAGTLGLGGPTAHLVVADATQADGTIGINGVITVNAPTSTPAGVYVGTVTITVEN